MSKKANRSEFQIINQGYNSIFKPNELSLGLVIPIENYSNSPVPTMKDHLQRVQQIEELGFKALWVRDIPFNVPSFGDAGQLFDPFTYLGYLAGQTSSITLGIASIALPLHHPVHVAKSAASIDQLSGGRFVLGVASGDRYDEYPAMGINHEQRGNLFRASFEYIREAEESFPTLASNPYGELKGNIDILPKPTAHKIPMLITGYSQQSLEWNVENGDGWMSYPKNLYQQKLTIEQWRELIAKTQDFDKPFIQPLYVVLQDNDDFKPEPIPLGFKIGANYLIEYLDQLKDMAVNHVALNLRFNSMDMNSTLERIANKVLPHFHTFKGEQIVS
ncbi:LLM class oxidoreductase [Flammeovirgaceae bacterium SG7u.111]|nr:LLM class oxidoreductase [Flammeovirgaceae bacterium SG7u.132]WPO37426.1 LLM class oxidoreductase [Flammeovirgaceae bacterium SG7u.111]